MARAWTIECGSSNRVESTSRGGEVQVRGARRRIEARIALGELAEVDSEHDLTGGDEEERVFGVDEAVEPRLVIVHVDDLLDVERERLEPPELAQSLTDRRRRMHDLHLGGRRRRRAIVEVAERHGGHGDERGGPGETRELSRAEVAGARRVRRASS